MTKRRVYLFLLILSTWSSLSSNSAEESVTENISQNFDDKKISEILVIGNKITSKKTILAKIPYKKNMFFSKSKTAEAISNIYALGYFNKISLEIDPLPSGDIKLYIVVDEKKPIDDFVFTGNKAIKTKDLKEKFNLNKWETVSQEDLDRLCALIADKFKEEGYLFAKVTSHLEASKNQPGKLVAHINVDEGVKSTIISIKFSGNKNFTENKLKKMLLTSEYWILGVISGAGRYIPEMVKVDRNRIEHFYKDNGYLMAKVTDVDIKYSNNKRHMHLTFNVSEGDLYKVRSVSAPGDDIFLEDDLLPHIDIEAGQIYPHSKVIKTIDELKDLWGEKGYVNADVHPSIIPDEKTSEVDITFYTERGNAVRVNRIDITGNEITKDRVIRRKIDVQEGDMITSKRLQKSKNSIDRLSYFKRGGVNWRIHRINDELADLEMRVEETLTGQFNLNLSYGSSPESGKSAIKAGIVMEKRNFMGEGLDVGFNSQLQLVKNGSRWFELYLSDPHLFDSNISGRFSAFNRHQDFDQWRSLTRAPSIQEYGGSTTLGFMIPEIDNETYFEFETGLMDVDTKPVFATSRANNPDVASLQKIIDRSFQDSYLQWFALTVFKDTRNHMMYPSTGYKLLINNRVALPGINDKYSFIKSEFEMSYYTPLIGEDSLVLMLHGKAGIVYGLSNNDIPYKEYYHLGGQGTVRGFKFGEIGPSWNNVDPLGARNAVQFNAELIFPILPDYSMKAHLFYDGGAGWDTDPRGAPKDLIRRNKFNFRHSVGFGFNLTHPQPIKIDWGYKLDRDKKQGETPSEFHLSANYAF